MGDRREPPGPNALYYADGVGGHGLAFTAREKAICLKVYETLGNIIDGEYIGDGDPNLDPGITLPAGRWRPKPRVRDEFSKVTGFDITIIDSIRKEIRDTGGYIKAPVKRGRKHKTPDRSHAPNLRLKAQKEQKAQKGQKSEIVFQFACPGAESGAELWW